MQVLILRRSHLEVGVEVGKVDDQADDDAGQNNEAHGHPLLREATGVRCGLWREDF